jgi:alpha-1,6-mannosyltransferase
VAQLDILRHRTVTFGLRFLGIDVPEPPHTVAALHTDEAEAPGLSGRELVQLRHIRMFGATGSVLMAIGALGAGAQPVLQNPTQGVRVLGLFSRVGTSSLVMCMTGTAMVVLAWLMLGRFAVGDLHKTRPPRRCSRSQLDRTLLLWILPLTVAPPMFSRDVYSYLAQSQITAMGIDPYKYGPAPALGVGHVLTRTVPNIWRNTPAPYGPLFLWMGRGISALTGNNIVAGIFVHRLLALVGVALIVWALPRLAKRCGVAEVSALWLGAANPLLLFHLVSGVHNEALMMGFMLSGVELAMAAITRDGPIRGRATALLLTGCTLIVLSSAIKLPGLVALPFVGLALVRRRNLERPDRAWRNLAGATAGLGALAIAETLTVSYASGLGLGWIHTLNTANVVRSWMSVSTSLGVITGFGGVLLGLGDHTTSVLSLVQPIGQVVAGLFTVRMLIAVYTGRLPAIGALGVSLGAIVLFWPVVQPWYLLWGVLPLAAWATRPLFRVPTIGFSALVCIIQMPSGQDYSPFVIVEGALATLLALGLLVLGTRRLLPWRFWSVPDNEVARNGLYADHS